MSVSSGTIKLQPNLFDKGIERAQKVTQAVERGVIKKMPRLENLSTKTLNIESTAAFTKLQNAIVDLKESVIENTKKPDVLNLSQKIDSANDVEEAQPAINQITVAVNDIFQKPEIKEQIEKVQGLLKNLVKNNPDQLTPGLVEKLKNSGDDLVKQVFEIAPIIAGAIGGAIGGIISAALTPPPPPPPPPPPSEKK